MAEQHTPVSSEIENDPLHLAAADWFVRLQSTEVSLERMANEAEQIAKFLGAAIYDKLKSYCSKLVDQAVRRGPPKATVISSPCSTMW